MNTNKKRFSLIAGTVAVVLAGAGVAFAYWTTTGSGTGTGTVGTNVALTVTQDSTVTGLVPGGAAKAIDFTVTNPAGAATAQISNVVIGFGTFAAGCSAADFTLTQPSKPSVGTPLTITGGASLVFTSAGTATATAPTGAAITMINTASNQDACKLSTVNLTYVVS